MCAQYMLKLPYSDLCGRLLADPWPGCLDCERRERVFPHQSAPVLLTRDGKRYLVPMNFSLIPSWSKERKMKFATYNARIETVDSKATWKSAFARRRCLVPLSGFVEASRSGAYAGYMVRLESKRDPILAAGIYDTWKDPSSGEEVMSFAILTEDAPPSVLAVGHDRCPIFVREEAEKEWLDEQPREPHYLRDVLLRAKADFIFDTERDRPLKAAKKADTKTGTLL